jgi:hypothetical protein
MTPAAGSNLNVALSTTGDFAVNTSQLYVDTSAGNVGIGTTAPVRKLDVIGSAAALRIGLSASDSGTAPTTIKGAYYLKIGGKEFGANSYRLIAFGYDNGEAGATSNPAYIGYQETDAGGYTKGDLVFGTSSDTTGNTQTERMRILSTGNVGIGTTAPAGLLHVSSDTAATGLTYLTQANATADGFDVNFRKARGTGASPTVITSADELGVINFTGYGGAAGYITGAAIKGISSGTIADSRVPGQLSFWTGTNAAPSVLTERMTIDNAGNVGIGTTTPNASFML